MKIPLVRFREGEIPKNAWIKYLSRRMKQNKNNLICISGPTGSGKTWSAIAICEKISKEFNVPFGVDNIVFGIKEFFNFATKEKTKLGTCVIYDEAQVDMSNVEWQKNISKIFNFLISTFRYQNLTVIFTAPYEDLLNKSTRKLFHALFKTESINVRTKRVKIKPYNIIYDSHFQKFRYPFLKVHYKPANKSKFKVGRVKHWNIPKPELSLVKAYEAKRLIWHKGKKKDWLRDLDTQKKEKPKISIGEEAEELLKRLGTVALVANALGITKPAVYMRLKKRKEEISE